MNAHGELEMLVFGYQAQVANSTAASNASTTLVEAAVVALVAVAIYWMNRNNI